jgi:hypothetical protein
VRDCISLRHTEERQRTAAPQDAAALFDTLHLPQGFEVRLSSAAFKSLISASKHWSPAARMLSSRLKGRARTPLRAARTLRLVFALVASCRLAAAQPTLPLQTAPQTNSHPFACADYSQGKVFLVSRTGEIEWEYQTASCNDLWVLPSGNLLFNTGHGVREVNRDKRVVFDYQSRSEIYACQRLTNGNTFIGECNSGRLLEVEPSGRIAKEIRLLPVGKDGGHLYMRNARRLPNGHYLVAHYGEEVVREYDVAGQPVLTLPATGGPHSVARLPNGHTLISCGDRPGGSRIFEVDGSGKTVWQVQNGDLPGISLKFLAGFQRLPNGNTVFANWLGHGQFGKAPHLIEVTPDKRVVWSYANHQTMRTIASLQLLDLPGDATGSTIWH